MAPDPDGSTPARAQANGGSRLSLDACLELLADNDRRVILQYFLESGEDHAPVDEIVSALIDEEERATGERPGRDSVALTLFHIHLPKFADANIIEYDTRNLEIRYHSDPYMEEVFEKIQELDHH